MIDRELNGDQALAFGALDSGVKLVTSYPGSPSSGTVEALIQLADKKNIYVEWSCNEKVAVEMGIGASIAGRRALVCVKSVGMNAMIDPLMALNLTPVHGGLVILLGDDPGGYGSQNDQDSRPFASILEMPMMEPSGPAEGYAMMRDAFAVSEKYKSTVIIRETRSFTEQTESIQIQEEPGKIYDLGLSTEEFRFVPVPKNAVQKHRELHERLEDLKLWFEDSIFNRMSGSGRKGIIGAGFAYQKLLDALGGKTDSEMRLLKLGILYPLPKKTIAAFLWECDEVLIVEENEPYLEGQIKAIAHDSGCRTKIYGKESRHISLEGELFRWQIQQALLKFFSGFAPERPFLEEDEEKERPKKENYCADCGYSEIVDILLETAESLGHKPVLVGDPGCLVTVADRLLAKYAIGSSVGVADGLKKAGIGDKVIALFGDSSFFHTTLPAVCNAVHNQSEILMVVLDNGATAASGFQPHPGVGRDVWGKETPALDMEKIARACGVQNVFRAQAGQNGTAMKEVFQTALNCRKLSLVIVRINR
jgi:indolepyruvate ferredoxin oxidoreductase alpha subunit